MKHRLLKQIFLISSLLMIIGIANLSLAQNVGDVIQNYGFEEGLDADGVPTGCILGANDYNGNGEFILDETDFHSGAAAGLIQGTDANDISLDPYLPLFNVQAGGKYSYSVWIKTIDANGDLAVQATNETWSWVQYDDVVTNPTEWTEYTGEFTATEAGKGAIVIGYYDGPGKILVDDCTVTVLEKGTVGVGDELFASGFEQGADSTGQPVGTAELIDWDANGTVGEVSEEAHTGTYSATIYNPDVALAASASMDVLVDGHEANAEYNLKIWIKTADVTAGEAQVITEWDNARFFKVSGTTDWTEYTLDYIAPTSGRLKIRLHAQAMMGQAFYDDLVITKTKAGFTLPTDEVANPGLEIPNEDGDAPVGWSVEAWGSGSTEIGFAGNDTARYIWDNTVFHSGAYSGKIQVTPADVARGSMDAGWVTRNLEFVSGGVYEFSYWAKTNNFTNNQFRISIGYNNVNLTQTTTNTDWVQVKDTLIFPTDQDENGWRNQMRFRLGGDTNADTLAEAWFDDVAFTLLGSQSSAVDTVIVYRAAAANTVDISWIADSGVDNPIYHILMQPVSADGVFDDNILSNPGFEEPNDDGSAPLDWSLWTDAAGASSIGEFPGEYAYEGNFGVSLGELDPTSVQGVHTRWWQQFDRNALSIEKAYMYGAMVKFDNVVAQQDSITNAIHPDGYYYTSGVSLWYDRYDFTFQNPSLIPLGFSSLIGSSDGWVQLALPLGYDQAATRHQIGIELGSPSAMAKGELFVDNAFVVPFEEVATSTTTSATIENVPDGVKYFAVYVEDPSGEFMASPATIGLITNPTGLEEQTALPNAFKLQQNYPNPFNPTTKIEYTIPSMSDVKLSIYNILGQEVAILVDLKDQSAGNYKIDFNASSFASGVYFYQITTNNHVMTKKMMLLK